MPSTPTRLTLISPRSFAVRLGLPDVPASAEDVHREMGDRLDPFRPRLTRTSDGRLVVFLTIGAQDLWAAVLLAMAAVTGSGYPPEWIQARPVE